MVNNKPGAFLKYHCSLWKCKSATCFCFWFWRPASPLQMSLLSPSCRSGQCPPCTMIWLSLTSQSTWMLFYIVLSPTLSSISSSMLAGASASMTLPSGALWLNKYLSSFPATGSSIHRLHWICKILLVSPLLITIITIYTGAHHQYAGTYAHQCAAHGRPIEHN